MKKIILVIVAVMILISCKNNRAVTPAQPVEGTWRLITGMLIENGDTVVTDYTKSVSFIKIINKTHFAFLLHDLNSGKDSTAAFTAGGGRYTLDNDTYTEHLEYCTAREWEGNDFSFTVRVSADSLVQTGIEKIEGQGVDRLNIEKYVRVTE